MSKKRIDEIIVARGLAKDKNEAFILVTEGRFFVNGQKAVSPAQPVGEDAKIEVRGGHGYVGRGALKLEAALENFVVDVSGKICVDIGAATGGFTEVLFKRGAKKVYAIDTAKGKLALKLREDPRVVVMEGTDVRDLKSLPEMAEIVTIDVSLISLRNILSSAGRFLKKDGSVVALFKPQYETRNYKILRHGIVKDAGERERLLMDFMEWARANKWQILDWMTSPIRGSEGNVEYLFYLGYPAAI